jgi:hypothetical protein
MSNPFPQQLHIHEEDLYVWPTSSKCIEYAMSEHCKKKEKSQISLLLLLLFLSLPLLKKWPKKIAHNYIIPWCIIVQNGQSNMHIIVN